MVDNIKTKKEPYRYGVATEPTGITAIKSAAKGLMDFASPPVDTKSATVGLPKTTPFSEAKKAYSETINRPTKATVPPTEQYVPAPGGTTKPYGYPEEGKVYTEADLGQPMTQGGFGYVSRGLPEARATVEDYIRETITKLQDRGDKLALNIESGFATGRRLTAAADELRNIQSIIPTLLDRLSIETGMGARGTEAGIGKTEAERAKLEKETAGLPSTFVETKELAETKVKGLEEITYTEYIKGKNKILTNSAYLTEEDRQAALDNYEAQYPQFNVAGRGLPNDTGGYIPQAGEEKTLPDGSRWRRTATGWQRWRE